MKRVWVGGATGFLGKTLVETLCARGGDLVAVSKSGGRLGDVEVQPVNAHDAAAVERSAAGCELALYAIGKVSRDAADGELLHSLHVKATQIVLPALRRAGVRRVVYASTSGTIAVGTDPQCVYDEQSPTPHAVIAKWPYYRSKLYAEQAALLCDHPGFEVVVVNPSLLLGPGDSRGSSNSDVRKLLAGTLPALPRGGLAVVDVRDVASAMISALSRGRRGQRYLLSAANLPCDVFFGRLARMAGVQVPKLALPKNRDLALGVHWLYESALKRLGTRPAVDRSSVDMGSHFWYCDSSLAARELGFAPRQVQATLYDTVQDLLGQGA